MLMCSASKWRIASFRGERLLKLAVNELSRRTCAFWRTLLRKYVAVAASCLPRKIFQISLLPIVSVGQKCPVRGGLASDLRNVQRNVTLASSDSDPPPSFTKFWCHCYENKLTGYLNLFALTRTARISEGRRRRQRIKLTCSFMCTWASLAACFHSFAQLVSRNAASGQQKRLAMSRKVK